MARIQYLTQVAQILSDPKKPASQGLSVILQEIKNCDREAPLADLHKTTQVALLALGQLGSIWLFKQFYISLQ